MVYGNRNIITSTFLHIKFFTLEYFVFQFFYSLSDYFPLFTPKTKWINKRKRKNNCNKRKYRKILIRCTHQGISLLLSPVSDLLPPNNFMIRICLSGPVNQFLTSWVFLKCPSLLSYYFHLSAIFFYVSDRPIPLSHNSRPSFYLIQITQHIFLVCSSSVLFVSNGFWNQRMMTNTDSFILPEKLLRIIHIQTFPTCKSSSSSSSSL